MRLIIGLGNPGDRFVNTRHNTGFLVLDKLAVKLGAKDYEVSKKYQSQLTQTQSLILAKPQTFMNDSGSAVKKIALFYKIKPSDIWVIHDDLDIKLGEYKIQKGIGPKVHYGLLSIEEKIGTKDFWRVRVGIDNRGEKKDSRENGEEYVLQNFTEDERINLDGVIGKIITELTEKII